MKKLLIELLAAMILFGSCVSQKKYKAALSGQSDLAKKYNDLQSEDNDLKTRYSTIVGLYKTLSATKDEVEKMNQIQLDTLTSQLQRRMAQLQASEDEIASLNSLLMSQHNAQHELLDKITQSLVGFAPEDLSVEMRADGKIYVSLSEKLLFKTGRWDVDPKGKEALKKVADILSKQPDIDVEVEGHTDNVPLKGSIVQDNWDLSVMRATSIVRVLVSEDGLNPKQVTAAGRGEYYPVASNDSDAGKAKNRRTEIILSPKLSDIMKILDTNH